MASVPELHSLIKEHSETELRLKENVPARFISTFSLGGALNLIIEPLSISALTSVLQVLSKENTSQRILGAGSNIVLPDSGVEDPVIHLGREFNRLFWLDSQLSQEKDLLLLMEKGDASAEPPGLTFESVKENELVSVLVLGGTSLMGLSRKMSLLGLSGLEFAAGIPAQLGGAVRMNAGAHGHSLSEVVEGVFVVNQSGELEHLSVEDLEFSYRKSAINSGSIVLGAVLGLSLKDKQEVTKERATCLAYRKKTQPLHLPSAGSVFRNPLLDGDALEEVRNKGFSGDVLSAGWLIEQVGLKGHRQGGVEFSELHANWLVKVGETAVSEDVVVLVELAKKRVFEEFSIELETEIIFW